jgi:hypothetical protein
MGTIAQPVKPEPSTIAIMIKFADTRLQTNTVLTQVRRHLPDLWEVLPQNPQNMEPPPDVDQPP